MEERELLAALRRGDEAAFVELVERYSGVLLHVATAIVRSRAVAEEVVQEAWVSLLRGLDRFEGRSSLKTWLVRVVENGARTRAAREHRTVPFSALAATELSGGKPAVDPDRFLPADDERWPGHWAVRPRSWEPEGRVLAEETRSAVVAAIDGLPPAQRTVIALRDIGGWTSAEVCDALELSEGNQRVLLHRARSAVRRALEQHLADGAAAAEAGTVGAR